MKILENVPIANLTTMRLGGNARYVIEVETMQEVPRAYDFAYEKELPVFILGGGANTIGRDEGYPGVIIVNKIEGIFVDGDEVRAMGGEKWDDVVEAACMHGLSGIEAMSAIPGTVGAAPVQNIGAYGQDISQTIASVEAFDTEARKIVTISKAGMKMRYRQTIFNTEMPGRYFIVSVTLKLNANAELHPPFYTSLQKYIDEHHVQNFSPMNIRRIVCEIRANKLPDPATTASAGSFFKNLIVNDEIAARAEEAGIPVYRKPGENKINTGWLIEAAGLKGRQLHGFYVSDKAALVLINEYAHTYAELAAARAEICQTIKDKFGFTLEQEPVEITVKE